MPLNVIRMPIENAFETEVARAVRDAWNAPELADESAHLFSNLIVTDHNRRLPNEHDIVLLSSFGAFSLDAKGLAPGEYRGSRQRPLEWRRREGDHFKPTLERMQRPFDTAFHKGQVLRTHLVKTALGFPKEIPTYGVVVVPDSADLRGVEDRRPTFKEIGIGLLNCGELREYLVAALRRCTYPVARRRAWDGPVKAAASRFTGSLPARRPCDVADCELLSPPLATSNDPVKTEAWRARHREFSHGAFVKIYYKYPWPQGGSEFFRQLVRQMEILRQARHPNVIQLRRHEDEPDALVLEFEFFDGMTLRERVEALGPLSTPDALRITARVADAVEHIHALGGRHRALSPESIRLSDPTGTDLRVVGFSSLTIVGRSTVPRYLTLSPFIPPELRDAGDPRAKAPTVDVYGVGKILEYALGGRRIEEDPGQTPAWRATLPDPLAALLERACAPDPGARHDSLAAFRAALHGCQ
jgi:hypothetical protein